MKELKSRLNFMKVFCVCGVDWNIELSVQCGFLFCSNLKLEKS